jgi:hypothetical protein
MDLRIGSASRLVTDANQDYKGLIFFYLFIEKEQKYASKRKKEKESQKRNFIIYLLKIVPLFTIPLVRVHLLLP